MAFHYCLPHLIGVCVFSDIACFVKGVSAIRTWLHEDTITNEPDGEWLVLIPKPRGVRQGNVKQSRAFERWSQFVDRVSVSQETALFQQYDF